MCVSPNVSHTLRQAQSRDLEAICDDAESGLMQEMVTITHNNRCAEMLATVRRGPFARSTQEERIEFLRRMVAIPPMVELLNKKRWFQH